MVGSICKKKCSIIAGLAVVAIAVAIWFVLFGASSLINKATVEANLKAVSEQLAQEAKNNGKDASLTYGNIDIEGWGYNKRAVVNNLAINLSDSAAPGYNNWSFSTARFQVTLDPANAQRVLVEFPEPINVSHDGQARMVVQFPSPLGYAYLNSVLENVRTVRHEVYVPSSLTLMEPTAQAAAGETPADAKQTVISYKANPTVQFVMQPEQNFRMFSYAFSDISVTGAAGNMATVSDLSGHFEAAPSAEGRLAGKYVFALNNVVLKEGEATTKPYGVNLDVGFDGDIPPQAAGDQAAIPVKNMQMQVNSATFSGGDFKINMDGKLESDASDPLFYGELKLDIDNVPQFLVSEIIPASARGAVEAALEKISGQKIGEISHLSVPLKRERGGVFYVGQTTFDGVASAFVADMLAQRPAQPAQPLELEAVSPAAGDDSLPLPVSDPVPTAPAPIPTPLPSADDISTPVTDAPVSALGTATQP